LILVQRRKVHAKRADYPGVERSRIPDKLERR
jgi:hypothetical protein